MRHRRRASPRPIWALLVAAALAGLREYIPQESVDLACGSSQ